MVLLLIPLLFEFEYYEQFIKIPVGSLEIFHFTAMIAFLENSFFPLHLSAKDIWTLQ